MSEYHDQFSELLGAYALDAVDPDEQAQIELHLRTCPGGVRGRGGRAP